MIIVTSRFTVSLVFASTIMLIGCKDETQKKGAKKATAGESAPSRLHKTPKQKNLGTLNESIHSGLSRTAFNAKLHDSSDSDIVSIGLGILSTESVKPESEMAERVGNTLSELIRRRSAKVGELLQGLPPGTDSEAIVTQAFSSSNFASVNEVFSFATSLTTPEFSKPAIDGAIRQLIYRIGEGKTMSGVTPDELSKMKAKGLSDGHFIKLICLGLSNQEYNLASAAKYIPLSDQGIFSDIIGRAPTETVQSLIKNTYLNGESVNKVGLAIFAKNLADTPDDAIKWMTTLPSGDSNIAAKSIFSTLMEADPRKASSLLGAMSEGPLRDEGTVVLIKNCLKNGSFSDAQAWLSQISDPKLSASTSELIRKASSKADSR